MSNSVEVSEEIELSSDFMRAGLKDRSDLFGPRPTVPLTKRARLLSYVHACLKSRECNAVINAPTGSLDSLFNSHSSLLPDFSNVAGIVTNLGGPIMSCTRRRRWR